MCALKSPPEDRQFPMHELEQIEAAIRATSACLAALQCRRSVLAAEMDRITQPAHPVPARLGNTRPLMGRGVEYRGKVLARSSCIDIHMSLLQMLWMEFPERREAIAMAIGECGTTRAYVAQSREALFPGQSTAFAMRYSRTLIDGWYVDINLNQERMRRILPVAVRAAGLTWGKEVRVYWRASPRLAANNTREAHHGGSTSLEAPSDGDA